MPAFSDYFSETAKAYAFYRPHYPETLFAWLATKVSSRSTAWDCGTGTGQAALPLALHFEQVIASDPSEAQLRQTQPRSNISYLAMTGEWSALRGRSVNLITVAQALHWLDPHVFYAEVHRVLRPGGLLAVWSYGLASLGDEALDISLRRFYSDDIGGYWPSQRKVIDAGLKTLPFPLDELPVPAFAMEAAWTLDQLAGYLGTWSAVTRYRKAHGEDPVAPFVLSIGAAWGEKQATRRIAWPLDLRVGRL